MSLNLDASPEEIKVFLEEVEEHFQSLEEDLVQLEKDKEFNEDLIQEIFRASHTLKGSSATIGHNRMAELTHAMENVLDKLRKKQLSVTSNLIDILFECLDYLRVLKDEIINDEESDLDLTEILDKLGSVHETGESLTSQTSDQLSASAPAGEKTAAKVAMELNWNERDIIFEAAQRGLNPYLVQLFFEVENEMLAVRMFVTIMAFKEKGEIVKTIPSIEEIEQEQVAGTLTMLVLFGENEETVKKFLSHLPNLVKFDIQPYKETPVQDEKSLANVKAKTGAVGKSLTSKKTNRTVRVDVELLDSLMNLVGELVIDRTRLFQILGNLEVNSEINEISEDLGRTSVHIARVTTQLQEQIMKARMLPVESLFNKFPRMVRDLSMKAGKEINFIMTGQETELDRSIIEEIGDPLIHLLRNAVDHGIEPPDEREAKSKSRIGQIKLQASHEENHIIITIKDDGRGIDPEMIKKNAVKKGLITEEQAKRLTGKEAVNLIYMSGLSTAVKVSDVSGRGVGMDVVKNNIEKINGAIEINSVTDQGTEFKIKLPLTLAIIRALLVSIGKAVYAIPLSMITETIRMQQMQIEHVNNREVIVIRGKVLPLVRLRSVFVRNNFDQEDREKLFVVVVNLAGQQVGLVVDSLVGEQEIVIKSLGKYIGEVQGISGATILGDGKVALIVDVSNLIKKAAS